MSQFASFNNLVAGTLQSCQATITMPEKKLQAQCNSCAGPLNLYKHKCEYCGTPYVFPNEVPVQNIEEPAKETHVENHEKSMKKWVGVLFQILGIIMAITSCIFLFKKSKTEQP